MSKRPSVARLPFLCLALLLGTAACKKQVATGNATPPPPPVATIPSSAAPTDPDSTPTPTPMPVPVPPPTPGVTPDAPAPTTANPAAPVAPAAVAGKPAVDVQNFDFQYLQLKGKVQYETTDDKQEAQINIRMRRDSVIWATVGKLGIEGIRVVITPDTVVMINRLQRSYFAGGFSALKRRFRVPVTFQQLQAALVANYLPSDNERDASESADAPVQTLHHDQERLAVEQFVNREKKRMVKLSVVDQRNGNALTANYDDFKPMRDGEREFPYALLLSVLQPPGPNAPAETPAKTLLISLNHKNVAVPEGKLEFPLAVPADYERK